MKPKLLFFSMVILLSSCVDVPQQYSSIPPGTWRGVLKIYDNNLPVDFEDNKSATPHKELPFNFEVKYSENNELELSLINGDERLNISEITVGLDRQTAKDTIIIDFPIFNTKIKAIHEEGILEGHWYVDYKENYKIPFYAQHGQNHRFTNNTSVQSKDFSGNWKTTFEFDKPEDAYPAIAEIKQEGNKITGSFLTETGDYRYLQGDAIGKKMFLSTFDGAHAFLFEAVMNEDQELTGIFKSGNHYHSNWIASRDEGFKLASADTLTKATNPENGVQFSFPNSNKDLVNLNDEKFLNKNKIINIMGTWCPNCYDEIEFLKSFKSTEDAADFEFISIAFERFKDDEVAFQKLQRYKKKMDMDWDILYGGRANKKENAKRLPFIDKLLSYPTMIILDKQNNIKYIHTGFSGPATSKYQDFISEFNGIIKEING